MVKFIRILRDNKGASAAEYALILAIVGSAIAIAAVQLGGAVSHSMNSATSTINTPAACAGSYC